jgi:hypothetical protein
VTTVVDHFSNRPREEALAYFYCKRDEDSRRTAIHVLGSFVKQLATSQENTSIQEPLVNAYQSRRGTGFASAVLSSAEAELLIVELTKPYARTYLVLDALDECIDESKTVLIATFTKLIKMIPELKILISSRRDTDITRQLIVESNLGIEATHNHADIHKFVLSSLQSDDEKRQKGGKPLSKKLKNDIVHTLLDKSHGM